ncbi:MAG: AAA family ATPase [Bacilli bacterium]|nr:AAA family ATPase [Bacilli bacterium]MBR4672180.1 AAA family ATPase [Bacilli bacterium]
MDEKMMEFEANFSVLDRYGTDITKDEYITNPAIGRDEQIRQLILILLTPEKSAILIGKPGIGKTAIVEGLAYRLQNNDVPDALKGYTIINIKTASLLGTMPSGESKVQKMIDELKTREKLILFIDEIHMLIGATDSSSLDFANIFKEGLGRGSIKVIGATTTEEYERYILRDKAFTRRFQKVEVPEPSRDETIKIMMGTLPKFEKQTGRKMKYTPFIQERIMSFLVDITSEYKRVYALGSRYPDVCLTLLKQAFSYTVYDNRPYMDIFDVRKAIENSKNIYPDVIRKELPNFDEMFNDIMLEEKGEKPIEEWRKDNTLTRAEQEGMVINPQQEEDEDGGESNLEKLENAPSIIDRNIEKLNRPVKSIISNGNKIVGSTSVSQGLKEKINRSQDASKLDDLLLSGELAVIKENEPEQVKMPTKFTVTDEIKPGVTDNILLGKPIQSTLEEELSEFNEIGVYNSSNKNKKGGKNMHDDRQRPVRQDISAQNFDKYSNFFSQGDASQSNNPANDFLPKNQMDNRNNFMAPPQNNYQNMPPQNNGYYPNNQMPPQQQYNNMPNNGQYQNGGMMPQGNYQNMPPQNNGYYPNNQTPPQQQYNNMPNNGQYQNGGMMPQGNYQNMPPQNNGYMPNNRPQNQMRPSMGPTMGPNQMRPNNGGPQQQYNNRPNNGQYQNGGMIPQGNYQNMSPQNNGYAPNNRPQNSQGGRFLNVEEPKEEEPVEKLFGAPMYSDDTNKENPYDNIPDIYGPMDTPPRREPRNNSFLDIQQNNQEPEYTGETLFGAPMYANENNAPQETSNKGVDIFGQLITDNMRIKNGKIVDEFPTFDKLNNLSNIKTVISDVRDSGNNNSGFQGNVYDPARDMNGYGNESPFNNMQDQNNMPSSNSSKNWTFIDDSAEEQGQQSGGGFQNDILEAANKKEENTIAPSTNSAIPTSNKDYYEDMKSGDFVNLNDLNNGKIKEEDSNKYMGIPVSENKPQFDLNLEGNKEEDEGFDDFYE